MTGVPLDELHCPTCGDKIVDFNLHSDPEDFEPSMFDPVPIAPITRSHWYLLCPQGHKWTVKTLWRAHNMPDRVQLDQYLGHA